MCSRIVNNPYAIKVEQIFKINSKSMTMNVSVQVYVKGLLTDLTTKIISKDLKQNVSQC